MTTPISRTERMLNATLRGITALMCRVDADQLKRVPAQGPLILVANHINFLEVPTIYARLKSSNNVTGFAKAETWNNPILGPLFDIFGAIPIRRDGADLKAMKRGVSALKQGKIVAVTPEGTRSNHGCLLPGHPGVASLALLSKAPILPFAHYGHENYRREFSNFRRPYFHVVVGKPFLLDPGGNKVTSEVRQQMTEEIMFQIASLLPIQYRGVYHDLNKATIRYLNFIAPVY